MNKFRYNYYESTPDEPTPTQPAKNSPDKGKVQPLSVPVDQFERVVGWLSDQEIAYIIRDQNEFHIQTYHIKTGAIREILTISEPILEVRIHPNLDKIGVVTSENILSASIHIYSVIGEKIDELIIESSEMYWDWDSSQSQQIFFSAFYEDWSFDSFIYSTETKELKRVDSADPFGKWGSDSNLNVINWQEGESLTGGAILNIDSETMKVQELPGNHTIYMESSNEMSMKVSISADQQFFIYTLIRTEDGKTTSFELPSISNYSQWFIPEIEWLSDGTIFTFEAKESGLMDTISPEYSLVKLSIDSTKKVVHKGPYQSFACAPLGESCLIGAQLENLLFVGSGESSSWIEVIE